MNEQVVVRLRTLAVNIRVLVLAHVSFLASTIFCYSRSVLFQYYFMPKLNDYENGDIECQGGDDSLHGFATRLQPDELNQFRWRLVCPDSPKFINYWPSTLSA